MIELLPSQSCVRPEVFGDPRPLVARLGTPGRTDLDLVLAGRDLAPIRDVASLRQFVRTYRDEVLAPVEFPIILSAQAHAQRYEVRELIALERGLTQEPRLAAFAAASHAVGRSQLRRLLPLRDQRLVRRYWQAVEQGEAHAWHPVVYGVVLALFSLPLRQGLLNYAQQTLQGFLRAAAPRVRLDQAGQAELAADLLGPLPALVDEALSRLRPVRSTSCLLLLPSSTAPTGP